MRFNVLRVVAARCCDWRRGRGEMRLVVTRFIEDRRRAQHHLGLIKVRILTCQVCDSLVPRRDLVLDGGMPTAA
jgi:hypothetical protein